MLYLKNKYSCEVLKELKYQCNFRKDKGCKYTYLKNYHLIVAKNKFYYLRKKKFSDHNGRIWILFIWNIHFFSLSYLNIVVMVGDLQSKIYYSILQFAGFACFGVS